MFIENVEKLDKDSFREPDLYHEIMQIDDELERQSIVSKLRDRAKVFGAGKDFDSMFRAAQKTYSRTRKAEVINSTQAMGDCLTGFSMLPPDMQFHCGEWIADDDGIRLHTDKGYTVVCPHPIFPTKILRNAETGKYKVELAFKVRDKIRRIYVSREVIATPTKILKLADDSVQVTSITAPLLVKYLSDIEALNPEIITEYASTSRLGWIEDIDDEGQKIKRFLPYQQDIIFDNELNTKALFDSIKHYGSRDKWFDIVHTIRKRQQCEVLINLAASFASVLVDPCNALPFILSLWGGSGIGKTVILKLCTSVWADPGEGKYITDAKATTTAMEMRLNILNSLPMTLDDMAQVKNQYDEDFSELIYRWCAGKGRDRSNKELGLNKLTSWRNCTITNGERALVDDTTQGGAVNRVIDIDASGKSFFDAKTGNETTKIIEKNYGFAGKEFIDVIQKVGFEAINSMVSEFYDKIKAAATKEGVEKEDKQIVPMALILTADKLIEEYLFKDGVTLDVDKCTVFLKNKGDVSEDKRAYEYLVNIITMNEYRFTDEDDDAPKVEKWGFFKDEDMVAIYSTAFDEIMKKGGFQSKAFLSWAKRMDLLELDKDGRPRKGISHGKIRGVRAVVIRIDWNVETAENGGFESIDNLDELPFN